VLTFDQDLKPPGIEEVTKGPGMPNVVDCGENNASWFRVRRSKKQLEIVSKETGKVTRTLDIDDHFLVVAGYNGLGPRQIGAALAALKL
jgi:galactose-1-phosphate uridylyltransferase